MSGIMPPSLRTQQALGEAVSSLTQYQLERFIPRIDEIAVELKEQHRE